jgi:4-amino-4-deoxy-L-arabinose transferase-like glycosyltransferase
MDLRLARPTPALLVLLAAMAWASAGTAQMTPTHRTTADGRPLASSLPSAAPRRAQARTLPFESLGKHLGAYVELTTVYGVHRQGRVEGVQGQTLRLRVNAGVGNAVVNVEREKIREIRYFE